MLDCSMVVIMYITCLLYCNESVCNKDVNFHVAGAHNVYNSHHA